MAENISADPVVNAIIDAMNVEGDITDSSVSADPAMNRLIGAIAALEARIAVLEAA